MKEAIQGKAVGAYNPAIRTDSLLFISGQIALMDDGTIISGSIADETMICLDNIASICKKAGVGIDKIVKTTIYLTDISYFQDVNRVYSEFFEGTVYPARSTVAVAALPKNARVEIEAIAVSEN